MELATRVDVVDQIVALQGACDAAVRRDQLAVEALGEGDVHSVVEAEVVAQLPGPCCDRPLDRVAAMHKALSHQPRRSPDFIFEVAAQHHGAQGVADLGIDQVRRSAAVTPQHRPSPVSEGVSGRYGGDERRRVDNDGSALHRRPASRSANRASTSSRIPWASMKRSRSEKSSASSGSLAICSICFFMYAWIDWPAARARRRMTS